MTRPWERTVIGAAEQRRHSSRLSVDFFSRLLPFWLWLAGAALVTGVLARTFLSFEVDIYALLDGSGVVLWVCGWYFAHCLRVALQPVLAHLAMATRLSDWLGSGMAILLAACALSLTLGGLLLAYNPWAVLQEISTQDAFQINVRIGPLFVTSLLLAGTAVLLVSATVALFATVVSPRLGAVGWGLAGLYANHAFVANLGPFLARAGEEDKGWFILPTVGQLAAAFTAKLADPQIRYEYLQGLFGPTAGKWLLVLIALAAGNLLLAKARSRPGSPKNLGLPLAAALSVLASFIYAGGQSIAYSLDPYVTRPGEWQAAIVVGLLALISSFWVVGVCEHSATSIRPAGYLWLLAASGSWVLATGPAIRFGNAAHGDVLRFAVVALLIAFVALSALERVNTSANSALRTVAGGTVLLATLLVAYPVDQHSAISQIAASALHGDGSTVSLGLLLLTALTLAAYRPVFVLLPD